MRVLRCLQDQERQEKQQRARSRKRATDDDQELALPDDEEEAAATDEDESASEGEQGSDDKGGCGSHIVCGGGGMGHVGAVCYMQSGNICSAWSSRATTTTFGLCACVCLCVMGLRPNSSLIVVNEAAAISQDASALDREHVPDKEDRKWCTSLEGVGGLGEGRLISRIGGGCVCIWGRGT
jgi:hypothetical protein